MARKPEKTSIVRERTILYGDDEWGWIADQKPEYKRGKHKLKSFLIVPSEHMVRTYPELQRDDAGWVYTHLGEGVWREYPSVWVNDTNTSRTNPVVRVYCGFDGRHTEETRRVKKYTDEIKWLTEDNDRLRSRIVNLSDEVKELNDTLREKALHFNEINRLMKSGRTDDDENDDD